MSERKFKLLKDLPFVKAGEIFRKFSNDGCYIPENKRMICAMETFKENEIEKLLGDWFEEVKEKNVSTDSTENYSNLLERIERLENNVFPLG